MIILIPALEPDQKLVGLLRRLGHHTVVIVDDGSGPEYGLVFDQARALGADVVTLPRNRGKGYALKAGFAHIRASYPDHDVVCADSDGQHRPEDIAAVAERLTVSDAAIVLGVRRFTGNVPLRSRVGNGVTRAAYKLATGTPVVDTQTGLRGYPAHLLPWLSNVRGERFEYELQILLRAARERMKIDQVEIATVYLHGNASSHFRTVRDSMRVYRPLLGFAGSSFVGFLVDASVLLLLAQITGSIAASAVVARLLSASINYGVNRAWVFGSGQRVPGRGSGPRYVVLALALLFVNVAVLEGLTAVLGSLLIAKMITESALFLASFLIQRRLVFRTAPAPLEPRDPSTRSLPRTETQGSCSTASTG